MANRPLIKESIILHSFFIRIQPIQESILLKKLQMKEWLNYSFFYYFFSFYLLLMIFHILKFEVFSF